VRTEGEVLAIAGRRKSRQIRVLAELPPIFFADRTPIFGEIPSEFFAVVRLLAQLAVLCVPHRNQEKPDHEEKPKIFRKLPEEGEVTIDFSHGRPMGRSEQSLAQNARSGSVG